MLLLMIITIFHQCKKRSRESERCNKPPGWQVDLWLASSALTAQRLCIKDGQNHHDFDYGFCNPSGWLAFINWMCASHRHLSTKATDLDSTDFDSLQLRALKWANTANQSDPRGLAKWISRELLQLMHSTANFRPCPPPVTTAFQTNPFSEA